jgi:hypothetical protein
MVNLKQTGKLPTKTQPKRKPHMTLQTKETEKSPSAEENLDMTQQEQSSQNTSKGNSSKRACITFSTQAGIDSSGADTITKEKTY